MSDPTPASIGGVTATPPAKPILSIIVSMMDNGKVHIAPGPGSPRIPTLDDIDALCRRVVRDVEIQMTADRVMHLQSEMVASARRDLAEREGRS